MPVAGGKSKTFTNIYKTLKQPKFTYTSQTVLLNVQLSMYQW